MELTKDQITDAIRALDHLSAVKINSNGPTRMEQVLAVAPHVQYRTLDRPAPGDAEIFQWLLGERGDFPERNPDQGLFWWRTELRKRLTRRASAPAPAPRTFAGRAERETEKNEAMSDKHEYFVVEDIAEDDCVLARAKTLEDAKKLLVRIARESDESDPKMGITRLHQSGYEVKPLSPKEILENDERGTMQCPYCSLNTPHDHARDRKGNIVIADMDVRISAPAPELDWEPSEKRTVADMANIGNAFMDAVEELMPKADWNTCPVELFRKAVDQAAGLCDGCSEPLGDARGRSRNGGSSGAVCVGEILVVLTQHGRQL